MPRRRANRPRGDQLVRVLVILALLALASWLSRHEPGPVGPAPAPPGEGYLFCSWNAENLFDDRDDPEDHDPDEDWFGNNPAIVHEKIAHLADALLRQAGGRGPDVLALVEVENRHAVELLRDELDRRLTPELHYAYLLFQENRTGRHIAPAILSRVPGRVDLRVGFRPTQRILAARLEAGGAPLSVLASHWTSRLTDKTGAKRSAYGDALYQAAWQLGPDADVLICGDFNDEPDDPSVRDHLHATGDVAAVRDRLGLLDLMAGKTPDDFGTYYYHGRPQLFDQIVASPGLLDPSGWLILPETIRTENHAALRAGRDGHPWRFGGPHERGARGYSDHFAVTVRLKAGN